MSKRKSTPKRPAAPVTAELLTMDQAIALLKTTRPSFYRWLRSGKVKGFKAGRQWRFRRQDIEGFLLGQEPQIELLVSPTPLLAALQAEAAKRELAVPPAGDDPLTTAADLLVRVAFHQRASDIHLEPVGPAGARHGRIRVRIDGSLTELCQCDLRLLPALIERFKRQAGLDVLAPKTPQDGQALVSIGDRGLGLRVSTAPTILGEALTIRLFSQEPPLPLDRMNFGPVDRERVQAALHQPNGLIIVSGPTGSGKTTVQYGLAGELNSADVKLITIEDPAAFLMPGAIQFVVDETRGLTTASLLRAAMRHDPDVLVVGLDDAETLAMALQAVLTGHLVIASMHCSEAAAAVPLLLEWKARPMDLKDALLLVTGQRLVRGLCRECSRETTLDAEDQQFIEQVLAQHGLKRDALGQGFREPVGCPRCRQGFRGRKAIIETLAPTPELKALFTGAPTRLGVREAAIHAGMTTQALDGLRKAAAGETTVREVRRVTGELLD